MEKSFVNRGDDWYLRLTNESAGVSRLLRIVPKRDYGDFRVTALAPDDMVTLDYVEEEGDDSTVFIKSTSTDFDVYSSHVKAPEGSGLAFTPERVTINKKGMVTYRLKVENGQGDVRYYKLDVERDYGNLFKVEDVELNDYVKGKTVAESQIRLYVVPTDGDITVDEVCRNFEPVLLSDEDDWALNLDDSDGDVSGTLTVFKKGQNPADLDDDDDASYDFRKYWIHVGVYKEPNAGGDEGDSADDAAEAGSPLTAGSIAG